MGLFPKMNVKCWSLVPSLLPPSCHWPRGSTWASSPWWPLWWPQQVNCAYLVLLHWFLVLVLLFNNTCCWTEQCLQSNQDWSLFFPKHCINAAEYVSLGLMGMCREDRLVVVQTSSLFPAAWGEWKDRGHRGWAESRGATVEPMRSQLEVQGRDCKGQNWSRWTSYPCRVLALLPSSSHFLPKRNIYGQVGDCLVQGHQWSSCLSVMYNLGCSQVWGRCPWKGWCRRKMKERAPAACLHLGNVKWVQQRRAGVEGERWVTCLSSMKELKHRD